MPAEPTAPSPRLFIGAMSGTSADGVDVALCSMTGQGLSMNTRLIRALAGPFDASLTSRIHSARSGQKLSAAEFTLLTHDITQAYVSAVRQLLSDVQPKGILPKDICAIGAHGQTLFHAPPLTLQVFNPALLAVSVGIPVVSDFRPADCALGGQGAPLVPLTDYLLFRSDTESRVLLNLGGIGNITLLPVGRSEGKGTESLLAFDTGPGNCLSDFLCRQHASVGFTHDAGGKLALSGKPNAALVTAALSDGYFSRPPPKSTDGPEMISALQAALAATNTAALPLPELLASAAEITAGSIAMAIKTSAINTSSRGPNGLGIHRLIASGGGTRNAAIMAALARHLPGVPIDTTDAHGLPEAFKEAVAFALLAAARLDNTPGNIPACTGASRPAVLGSVTLP